MQKQVAWFVRRYKSPFVWYQVSYVYEVGALRGFGVEDLWQSMQTTNNFVQVTAMQTMNQDL